MAKYRLLELDALRGLAALVVVLYHYFYRFDILYGHKGISVEWIHNGKLGVQLFFMVSGFVIFLTLNRLNNPLDFIVSRFSRLFPAYWVCLILTFVVVGYFSLPGREVSYYYAAINLTMLQEFFRVPHVDGVYWTLTVELTFYFWIFILYMLGGLARIEIVLIPLMMITLLHVFGFFEIHPVFMKIFVLVHLPFFVAGICFFKLVSKSNDVSTIAALLLSLVVAIYVNSEVNPAIFVLFYIIFYTVVSGRTPFLAAPPLIFLGGISYTLYLIHQNVGYVIIRFFYAQGWGGGLGIAFALLVSIVGAHIICRCIERPCLNAIRSFYKGNRFMQVCAKKTSRLLKV